MSTNNDVVDATAGALTVVGTGIHAIGHLTQAAQSCMKAADKLFYLISDPVTERYLIELNPTAESIHDSYDHNKDRFTSYLEMVERILREVRRGLKVCVAFYGHPGVFVFPSHEAIRQARKEGYRAQMMPAISAEDCLFADLGVDPAVTGCQSFEATDFLLFRRRFDPHSSLILWQVGLIGDLTYQAGGYDNKCIGVLVDYLTPYYGLEFTVIVYEASHFSIYDPKIKRVSLAELAGVALSSISTLYVPPLRPASIDEDMLQRLGIKRERLQHLELDI